MDQKEAAKKDVSESKTKRSIGRNILLILLIAFVALQFFQPDKNNQRFDMANDIRMVVHVPDSVHALLKTACYDCHSNQTNYPWYANIQPIGWWIKDHIEEGKSHINFHEFALVEPSERFPSKVLRQDHKLEEVAEQFETDEMPLKSYTLIHGDAKLSEGQKKMLLEWAAAARAQLVRDSANKVALLQD
jgi:hypothetical protein